MMRERTFRRTDPDFPTTAAQQRHLVASGRVEGEGPLAPRAPAPPPKPPAALPPAFTEAERSLVRRVHGYMPHGQLLAVLNERLLADRGRGAVPHDAAQLHAELASLPAAPGSPQGWAALRRLLAKAKADGTLARVDAQVVADFGVAFSLSAKQMTRLREIVLRIGEGED